MKATVIFGNPGTGKTYDLVQRIQQCKEQGYTELDIQVLSHTRVAAKEIATRAEGAMALTVHSLAYSTAKIQRDQVLSKKELIGFSEKIGVPMKGGAGDNTSLIEAGDEYIAMISYAANIMDDTLTYAKENVPIIGSFDEFVYFYKSYINFKNTYGYVDFDDMLRMAIVADEKPHFKVLFVDEAQDLSPLQWTFLYQFLEKDIIEQVVVTGDPDQALFSFGGADVNGMANFAEMYNADVTELTQSYRVPKEVHKLSETIIQRSTNRFAKTYLPTDKVGSFLTVPSINACDLEKLHGTDTLILYRTHAIRREVERELIRHNIPYTALNGWDSLFDSALGKAIKAYLKLLDGGALNKTDRKRIEKYGTPKCLRFIEEGNIDELASLSVKGAFFVSPKEMEYYTNTDFKCQATIKLSTIHGAKGMEADNVIVLDGITQRVIEGMESNLDDELRVWFVAVTRAKENLLWVHTMDAQGFQL